MFREISRKLTQWKLGQKRKPLILKGARQVGKTWALTSFGNSFMDGFAYFNFEKQPELNQLFETTKDVNRILSNLSLASGKTITTNTLIILDEIQCCGAALNSLKYFCENAPQYPIASAGSLLGITLAQGFPVGKVDFLELGPMTFFEFLLANGDRNLLDYLDSIDTIEQIPNMFFNPLVEKLYMYLTIGGMPEVVSTWTEFGDIELADKTLSNILMSYENDFGKHADKTDVPKIRYIWNSLPSQLARANKKFLYSAAKEGARAREYENALNWICDADIAKKVYRISKPGLPLSAYEDLSAFKIYMNDVGLLRKHARLSTNTFFEQNDAFVEFKGALAENFILQTLERKFETFPRYWANTTNEVDFIIQYENTIIPVEVKSSANIKSTSLKNYIKLYGEQTPLAVRFSLKNLSLDGNILNIPLFMADYADKLMQIALG